MTIGTRKVIPSNPKTLDSIRYAYSVGFSKLAYLRSHKWYKNGDSIFIENCYEITNATQPKIIKDTINIGYLEKGFYGVRITGYLYYGDSCRYDYYDTVKDSFYVSDGTAIESPPSIKDISIYPNPATSAQTLKLTLPISQSVDISLLDLQGREVLQVYEGTAMAGESSYQLDLTGLKGGVYFCRVSKADGAEAVKVMKQ